jgi:hypothetical protein
MSLDVVQAHSAGQVVGSLAMLRPPTSLNSLGGLVSVDLTSGGRLHNNYTVSFRFLYLGVKRFAS